MRPGWWCGGSAWLARCVHPWFQSKEGTICNICIFGCKIFWSWILRRIGNIFALLAWQIVACQRMITGTGKTGLNVCVNNSYNNITITTWSWRWRNWSILSDVYILQGTTTVMIGRSRYAIWDIAKVLRRLLTIDMHIWDGGRQSNFSFIAVG